MPSSDKFLQSSAEFPDQQPVYDARAEAIEACYALRSALRSAGVNCIPPHVNIETSDDLIMHMQYLTGVDAATLTALLRAGVNKSADVEIPRRSPFKSMSVAEIIGYRDELHGVLTDIGIDGLTQVDSRPGGRYPVMHLMGLDTGKASTLTSLLAAGMREHVETADALYAAFRAHGLDADDPVPTPVIGSLHIYLGDVSVPAALALGNLLGAKPLLTRITEFSDYPDGVQVMERLHRIMHAKTGESVDLEFHPSCMKCGHTPTITLGALSLKTAKRLLAALPPAPRVAA